MRLFLDDVRDPSYVGWFGEDIIVCRTATNAIEILRSGLVVEMSLDHESKETLLQRVLPLKHRAGMVRV